MNIVFAILAIFLLSYAAIGIIVAVHIRHREWESYQKAPHLYWAEFCFNVWFVAMAWPIIVGFYLIFLVGSYVVFWWEVASPFKWHREHWRNDGHAGD